MMQVQMSNHRNTRPGSVSSASSSSHGNVPRHSNPPSAAGKQLVLVFVELASFYYLEGD